MTAAVVQATEVVDNAASSGSVTVDKPTGTANGDLLIAAFSTAGTTWSNDGNLPAGWSLLHNSEVGNAGSGDECWVAAKVAGGSEPASYTFGGGGANHSNIASITRIDGQDTDWSLGIAVTHRTTGTRDTGTRRTIADNTLILHFVFNENDNVTTEDGGYPSGTTGVYLKEANTSGFGPSQGLAHETQATEGDATSRNWDTNFANTTTDHTLVEVYFRGSGESAVVPFVAEVTALEFETDTTNSIVLDAPPGAADGDLLVAHVAKDINGSTWTLPSNWTQQAVAEQGTAIQTLVATKVAGASEPSTYTFSLGTTSGSVYGGCIWRIPTGSFDAADPIDASATNSGTTGVPVTPSVTTSGPDRLILRLSSNDDNNNPGTFIGNFTLLYDNDTASGSDIGLQGGLEWQGTAGATGSDDFDLTGIEEWAAVTVAINPSASGGGGVTVGPSPASAAGATVDATVVLGATSTAPSPAAAAGQTLGPTVVVGGQAPDPRPSYYAGMMLSVGRLIN